MMIMAVMTVLIMGGYVRATNLLYYYYDVGSGDTDVGGCIAERLVVIALLLVVIAMIGANCGLYLRNIDMKLESIRAIWGDFLLCTETRCFYGNIW